MYNLLLRIDKAMNEEIKLIYFLEDVQGYIYFVLGKSNLIYKLIINKKYQKCNCHDFEEHGILCKHILFILFKVIRLYRLTLDEKIYLRRNIIDLYKDTTFIINKIFPELDWKLFKKYNKVINLKSNYFNIELHYKFREFYKKYNYMARKNVLQIETECPICLQKTKQAVKCDLCNTYFHIDCIFNWLDKIEKKKMSNM